MVTRPSVALRRVKIAGLATYVPPRLLTNADLEKMVDTSNEWILQRTGIRERHVVDPGVATSDLAKEAALAAIAQAGITPADIGFIVVGTTTPDMMFPSTACLLQHKIGAVHAWGFDLGAACSGFTFALSVGLQMVATGAHDHALVVGADVMSSIIDYQDRATCVLFGDGAGAVVLAPAREDEPHILGFANEIDGSGGPSLQMPAGGSLRPASHETVEQRLHYVKQDGAAVFKFAVRKTEEIARRVLDEHGAEAGGREPVRVAPGQPAHHPGGRRPARLRRPHGHHQPREVRQHHRRDHSARARGRHRGGPAEEGRPRPAGVGRRRLHRRVGAAALEPLDSRQGSAVSGQEEHPVTRQRDCVPGCCLTPAP